tara:strand:+ start:222 stop:500 length:279 start_codon:yes stop_codon:yes gene_type:complete
MEFNPSETNESMFVIAAFRYGLRRRSYAVSCITEMLIRLAPEMNKSDVELIIKEIDKNELFIPITHPEEWAKVKKAMLNRISKINKLSNMDT